MGRQGRVVGPPPQGPVPVLAGLMDGNGCSIGTHILSYKPQNRYSWQEYMQGCQTRSSMLQCKVFASTNAEDTEFS